MCLCLHVFTYHIILTNIYTFFFLSTTAAGTSLCWTAPPSWTPATSRSTTRTRCPTESTSWRDPSWETSCSNSKVRVETGTVWLLGDAAESGGRGHECQWETTKYELHWKQKPAHDAQLNSLKRVVTAIVTLIYSILSHKRLLLPSPFQTCCVFLICYMFEIISF